MAIEKTDPDLFHVLKRRRRTVAVFLKDAGVRTVAELDSLLAGLSQVYVISEDFTDTAAEYLADCRREDALAEKRAGEVRTARWEASKPAAKEEEPFTVRADRVLKKKRTPKQRAESLVKAGVITPEEVEEAAKKLKKPRKKPTPRKKKTKE